MPSRIARPATGGGNQRTSVIDRPKRGGGRRAPAAGGRSGPTERTHAAPPDLAEAAAEEVEEASSSGRITPATCEPDQERFLPELDELVDGAFYRRFLAKLDDAYTHRRRLVLFALPGDGKSTAAKEYAFGHGGEKRPGHVKVKVLYVPLPKARVVNDRTMRWSIERALGVPLDDDDKDIAHAAAQACLKSGVEMLIVDDVHECDINALNVLRGIYDVYDGEHKRLSLVLLAARVTRNVKASPPWPLLTRSSAKAWQFWRRLTVRRPVVVEGHDLEELGEVLQGLAELYRPFLRRLDLVRWRDVIWQGLVDDGRVDRLHTKRVSMDSILYVVGQALQDAYARRRTDIDPAGRALNEAISDLQRFGPRTDDDD